MKTITLPQLSELIFNLPAFKDESCKKKIESLKKQLDPILSRNNIKQYSVVFIGKPGLGKTTAICNWLGLLKSDIEELDSLKNVPLLTVSRGRTTAFEVHICQIEASSCIEIEYYPSSVQKGFIRDYCEYYYSKYDDAKIISYSTDKIHIEIDRIIDGITGYGLIDLDLDTSFAKDKIKNLIKKYRNFESFFKATLKIVNLSSRLKTTFTCEGKFEDWLQSTFDDINNGHNANTSIPKTVTICVGKKDLDLYLPSNIGEVIDTAGLDNTDSRDDLKNLITRPNTICYLMDSLEAPPCDENKQFLKTVFQHNEDPYLQSQLSLFVRCSESDLCSVADSGGDPINGEDIKLKQIELHIKKERIPYVVENTLFCDSMRAYTTEPYCEEHVDPLTKQTKRKLCEHITYDEFEAEEFRTLFAEHIQKIIDNSKRINNLDVKPIYEDIIQIIFDELKFSQEICEDYLSNNFNIICFMGACYGGNINILDITGNGFIWGSEGSLYSGHFIKGFPSGYGQMELPEGETFEGQYNNGK